MRYQYKWHDGKQQRYSYPYGYESWQGMKSRCLNPRNKNYFRYGARGITVCARWIASFDDFMADMGPPPSKLHSIERMDNSKGYYPSNCKWGTRDEQNKNRRSTRFVEHDGTTRCLKDWCVALGLNYKAVHQRVRRGKTLHAALGLPEPAYTSSHEV